MKLSNNLFKILSQKGISTGVIYELSLLVESEIYKAHFPGMPITPGVCIAQIVEELLCDYLQEEYKLSEVKNIKYLQVISPVDSPEINVELKKIVKSEDTVTLQAVVFNGNTIFTKLSIKCMKQ